MSLKKASVLLILLATVACSDDSGEGTPADAGVNKDAGIKPDVAQGKDVAAPDASQDPSQVGTTSGPVKGKLGSNFRAFLGIPYAAPPVGSLRWKAPTTPTAWTVPRDATKFGNICPSRAWACPRPRAPNPRIASPSTYGPPSPRRSRRRR